MERRRRIVTSQDWAAFYDRPHNEINVTGDSNRTTTFKTERLGVHILIVTEWVKHILAEPPTVKFGEEGDAVEWKTSPNYRKYLHDLLAYGTVLVVPNIPTTRLDVISGKDGLKFVERDGELLRAEYTRQESILTPEGDVREDQVRYVWKMADGACIRERTIGSVTEFVAMGTRMVPFLSRQEVGGELGVPIYANAVGSILEADETFSESRWDIKQSRKVVMVPHAVAQKAMSLTNIDDKSKSLEDVPLPNAVRQIPGTEDGHNAPTVYSVDLRVEDYMKDLDHLLHLAGMFSGFGPKYFSYDTKTGLKTATEVNADKQARLITANNIQAEFRKLILHLIDLEAQQDVPRDFIGITFFDNVISDEASYYEALYRDVVAGNISLDFYLQERYNADKKTIAEIRGDFGRFSE